MIENWLAAAAGRRTASVTPVAFVRSASSASNTVTFASAASTGQLIVVIAAATNATPPTPAAGFAERMLLTSGVSTVLGVWTLVAGGSEPTGYTFTNATHIVGHILSSTAAAPFGVSSSNLAGALVTSIDLASAAQAIAQGSMVFGAYSTSQGNGGARSFTNSFSDLLTVGSNRLVVVRRSYAAAASAQNTTASWATANNNNRGALFEIKGA